MSEKRKLPAFQSEAEEAQWWFDNREARGNEVAAAIRSGAAGRNTLADRVAASLAVVRVDPEDAAKARALAEQQGEDFQQFAARVFREGLKREVEQRA